MKAEIPEVILVLSFPEANILLKLLGRLTLADLMARYQFTESEARIIQNMYDPLSILAGPKEEE